ncbi:MAG: DUF4124 domain-containing protein [Thermomonas sp.]|uniref:DUF4124 domain-containing protein n=1 Tax=Thermomonas sp. TaxID=1971895 RepID=UPI0039E468D3
MLRLALLPMLALLLLPATVQAQAGGGVTVYRCLDASGKQALRDTPCPKGQKQQARDMLRPVDAPAKPAQPASTASTPTPPPAQHTTVYLVPPRAMYECTTPEGQRYTSDDDAGNPRWVPLWTLGYPVVRSQTSLGNNIGGPPPHPDRPMRPPPHRINWPVATGGGTWIRDTCVILPPSETCSRLRDRRDAIRTRFFNAQEKERDALRIEERGINARLANDCGDR